MSIKTRPSGPSTMYSETPCNECGGPCLDLPSGSIWCPAEDPHPGGHFVKRVAFERTPAKQAAWDAANGRNTQPIRPRVIKPQAPATIDKPSEPKPLYDSGYDDFVSGKDVK